MSPNANVTNPGANDVLFGVGKLISQHPGNTFLSDLVATKCVNFQSADCYVKGFKQTTAANIFETIASTTGGRFMQRGIDCS